MRIVFLAWRDLAHPRAGGSEVVVDRWASGMVHRGHSVTLVVGGPVASRAYPVVRSGGTYSQYLGAPAIGMSRLRSCDLVVDVSNGIPFFAPAWRRKPVLGVVHHVHRDQWSQYFPRPVAAVGNLLEQRVVPRLYRDRHVVGISPSTVADLVGLGLRRERVHLVANGLDDAMFIQADEPRSATPLFLALGRVAANKRLGLLLDMWDGVRQRTGGRLVIAGDGPDLPALKARAVPGVEFLGRVDEQRKRSLLAQAWFLVHAAPREGWGLVVMEAAAQGTPSLGFDVEGVRDAVVDGVTGRLARDPADFAAQWCALAADACERARLSAAASARSRDFTWDRALVHFEAAALAAVGGR